jgi:hypothetical protein
VENNTNALRSKISVAVGNLNHKILLNGVKKPKTSNWVYEKLLGCV